MKPFERVTIKQIAKEAGTSIGTVDRALSNRPGINPATKARVLQVAQELGYTPNRMASALSRKKVLRIGVVSAKNPADFYSYIDQGITQAETELRDYGVVIERLYSPLLAPDEQRELLENLDYTKYDGLVINAGGEPSVPYINKFVAEGVPVATFNSDSPGSDRLFFVGSNSRQSGRLGGEMMGKLLGGKGKVAIIGNYLNTTTFVDRFGGFCEVIQREYPEISIYPCAECYSNPARAYSIMAGLLKEDLHINGFFSTGYSATVGAVEAIKEAGRRNVTVIGYDLSESIMQALKDGWCTSALYQDPFQQSYQALRLMVRHLIEGWVPPSKTLFVEAQVVFRYNMDSYTKEHLQENPFRY
ncbi:substrate-binding domain-containing protein [Ruminococcaceae bacterium OttesenSCG-928-A16]|nr:substrate-binding domain-containing protein [Ruminococcaceae bacterium OttesenSCG-928-A16]